MAKTARIALLQAADYVVLGRAGSICSGFTIDQFGGIISLPATDRPQKITFAEMRDMGVRGLLIYCANYRCSHSIAISGDSWRSATGSFDEVLSEDGASMMVTVLPRHRTTMCVYFESSHRSRTRSPDIARRW